MPPPKELLRLALLLHTKPTPELNQEFWRLIYGPSFSLTGNDFLAIAPRPAKIIDAVPRRSNTPTFTAEHPHPKPRFAFILFQPFHYYLYRNICQHLNDAEFVIDATSGGDRNYGLRDFYDRLVHLLEQKGAHFQTLRDEHDPERFFERYEVIVSNLHKEFLDTPARLGKKLVAVMYGASKDLWNFGSWRRHFDYALTYGPYSHERMRTWTRSIIVGNPKYDDWFCDTVDLQRITHITGRLRLNRKTVLYLPTYGELGSLEFMVPSLRELARRYNVIVKVHHNTQYREKNRMAALMGDSVILADDFDDLQALFKISDVVISDNSGALFEAVLVDKPVVLVDLFSGAGVGENQRPRASRLSWDAYQNRYYAESLEQVIKREPKLQPGPVVVGDARECETVIRKVLAGDHFRENRRRLRDLLFSNHDGSAGVRAAEALRRIAVDSRPAKTLHALAVDVEIEAIRNEFDIQARKLRQLPSREGTNRRSANAVAKNTKGIVVSAIIPTYNRSSQLVRGLESLLYQQEMNHEEYEVIVVNDASSDNTEKIVQQFMRQHPTFMLRYAVMARNMGPAAARNVGVNLARGRYLAFTDDDCIVPPDWLLQLLAGFDRYPDAVMVGGWYLPVTSLFDPMSSHDEYLIWRSLLRYYGKRALTVDMYGRGYCPSPVGNSANLCVRKSTLHAVGGFDPHFTFAGDEDWELRKKILEKGYGVLYIPHHVIHQKKILRWKDLVRFAISQGWGRYVYYRLYPAETYSHWTLWRAFSRFVSEAIAILRSPLIRRRFRFILSSATYHFFIFLSKYVRSVQLLEKQKHPAAGEGGEG